MTQYKSFGDKRKFPRTFEKSEANLSEINNQNIKKLEARFRSENHYKPVTIIPVVSNHLVEITPAGTGDYISIDLINFPEWAINMIQPNVIFYMDSAYNPIDDVGSLSASAQAGTLKEDDISIERYRIFHWLTKLDTNYRFNFRLNVRILKAINVNLPSFSSIVLPLYANINLHIINERNYNELQSGK